MLDTSTDSRPMDLPLADLGPLAWVFDELRKSLDLANKAIRRFVRENTALEPGALDTPDTAPLRQARQQLHQAVGALEMVGLEHPAQVLRGMELAVQRFAQKPQVCDQAAAQQVEQAGFALLEYLQAVLNNKPVQPLALFPQHSRVLKLAGVDRIHPADLWSFDRLGLQLEAPVGAKAMPISDALRSLFERSILMVVKAESAAVAQQLARLSAGQSAGAVEERSRTFWHVASAFFEGLATARIPSDLYTKRAASRILLQFKGQHPKAGPDGELPAVVPVSETLLRDLLFFCAHAQNADGEGTPPHLAQVRETWGLSGTAWVDYSRVSLGQFDPALLVQARKRVHTAKESWGLFTSGDVNRGRQVMDQYSLIGESLVKLAPSSERLVEMLNRAVGHAVRETKGQVAPELSMEVATTTLYLEAAFEDFDPSDGMFGQRCNELSERLERVLLGETGRPLEGWMEQLYRRVSDRQTMGSVVGELKISLAETEKTLDQFFRTPHEKAGLLLASSQLAQMRGVLSVLGLDPAVHTVQRMRSTVDQILDIDAQAEPSRVEALFQLLGTNLSALSFLVDMLNYQPSLAKKLFVFDDASGELRPLMGRVASATPRVVAAAAPREALAEPVVTAAPVAEPVAVPEPVALVPVASQASTSTGTTDDADDDEDLRAIFLEEAREVVGHGLDAVRRLQTDTGDLEQLTTLRRAFHTLKGSSRMVGLTVFGDAAWAMEQLFNAVLAEQREASEALLRLAHQALGAFSRWADSIEAQSDLLWKAEPFVDSAQALRDRSVFLALSVPGAEEWPDLPPAEREAAEEEPVPAFEAPAPLIEEPADEAWAEIDFDVTAPAELLPEGPAGWPEPPLPVDADADAEVTRPGFLEPIDFALLGATLAPEAPTLSEALEAVDKVETVDTVPEPASAMDVPSMFDGLSLDFDDLSALASALDDTGPPPVEAPLPEVSQPEPAEPAAVEPLPEAAPVAEAETEAEHTTVHFPGEVQFAGEEPEAADGPATEPHTITVSDTLPGDLAPAPVWPAATAPDDDSDDSDIAWPDEQTRLIGPLRIDLKLYNVYLNEADEWSRRLCMVLSEWLLEHHEPLPPQAESLAHSLAGSSATVGFQPLSDIARALEHALEAVASHQREGRAAEREQAQLFADAAEDIRRLLHQFAAGFFKEPSAELIDGLNRLLHELPPVSGSAALDINLHSGWGPIDAQAPDMAGAASLEGAPTIPQPFEAPSAFTPLDFEATAFADVGTLMPDLPVSAPQTHAPQDIDDDIDALDTIDVDLFPIFTDEALELLPRLGSALRQWVARPDNQSARAEVLRNLHTIKGSARLAGALRLGEMAHRLETQAERLEAEHAQAGAMDALLVAHDALVARFELLRNMDPDAHAVVQVAPEHSPAPPAAAAELATSAPVSPAGEPPAPRAEPAETGLTGLVLPAVPRPAASRAGAAVRVRPELLDRLVNQTGELITTRSRMDSEVLNLRASLKDLTGNLERLRNQMRDMELQTESQMQSRMAQTRDADQTFDPLEFDRFTRVQEITRMMAESVNDVATVQRNLQRAVEVTEDGLVAIGRQSRELQRDLLRTRMVEFEGLSERLYRVVRQASKETGKAVRLDITGGNIEMDRGVLDRMTGAFEHILRNCVVHGIEPSEARLAAGKPAEGRIHIQLAQELNDVSVVFQDDGAGLNLPRLRERAMAMGLIASEAEMDDAAIANLAFTAGLSTATEVSSLAGRGVGMDVVRTDVVALGGRVETATQAGQGTAFKLVLPLTTAVTQVVMLRAGTFTVGVPSIVVERVRRITAAELAQAYEKGSLTVGEEEVPFFWAGALLQTSPRSTQAPERTLPVVIFRSAAQRVAMHVDEVLGNQEVVVKNLGSQLSRLPGLAGMSVLASGAVALIYNPVALVKVYGARVREWLAGQGAQPPSKAASTDGTAPLAAAANAVPLVLVVDDSITVRRVTQRLLQREGYRVALAADGLQALERLQQERPTVVLSDIEMPRMDGFDLVRNLRNDVRLASLPVIMITSRIAEKHREHARELGVDHYLGKPYSEDELLGLIAHYAQVPAAL